MKPIVAPTDFSPVSLNAVNYAADMAGLLGVRLNLLHVYAIPVPVIEVPAAVFNNVSGDMEAGANSKIEKLKDELVTRTGGKIEIRSEVRPGNVLQEIISYCNKLKPYAIVMGAESTNAFKRVVFGGKTMEALKRVEWPLIVVPPAAEFTNIRKIGFACDFREVAESVRVKEIRDIVEEFNAELHVLHISEENGDSANPEKAVEEPGWLQKMLADLRPKYHFIKDPEIEKSISEFAEKNNLDLLIIIPKRHSLVSNIFQHRHSKRLVLQTHVPVMALHE